MIVCLGWGSQLRDAQLFTPRFWRLCHGTGWRGHVPGVVLRRSGRSDKTGYEILLFPAGIIEVERSTQLLQALSREVLQNLIEPRLPRAGKRINELRLDAAIRNRQLIEVDAGAQLVRCQLGENCVFCWHLRITRGSTCRGGSRSGLSQRDPRQCSWEATTRARCGFRKF